MNTVVIVVIVLVVAMILGPVAMLRPSSAQKRKSALRQGARELGLYVGVRRMPARATDTQPPEHLPVYCVPAKAMPSWCLVKTAYAHDLNYEQWWQPLKQKPPVAVEQKLTNILKSLPNGVECISSTEQELAIFWKERGDFEAVKVLADVLNTLKAAQTSPSADSEST